jgi:hypothetical protein
LKGSLVIQGVRLYLVELKNPKIAKDIAGLKATTAGCDAIRSADIPPTRAMLDRWTECHFLRLIAQNNTDSDMIPDEPDDILDEEQLPVLYRWAEERLMISGLWAMRPKDPPRLR